MFHSYSYSSGQFNRVVWNQFESKVYNSVITKLLCEKHVENSNVLRNSYNIPNH